MTKINVTVAWSGHHSGVFGRQGATLQVDEESGAVFIARVFHGGAADRSGNVHCSYSCWLLWFQASETRCSVQTAEHFSLYTSET